MDTVFALRLAVFLPLLIAAAAGLIVLGMRLGKRRRQRRLGFTFHSNKTLMNVIEALTGVA